MTETTDNDLTRRDRIGFALPIHFAFSWDGIAFEATAREGDNGPELLLQGDIAAMPYTIESAEGRRILRDLLSLRPDVPCATVRLTERHMIRLYGRLLLGGNATPPRIVAAAAAIVASAKPLIDVILLCRTVAGLPQRPAVATPTDNRRVA